MRINWVKLSILFVCVLPSKLNMQVNAERRRHDTSRIVGGQRADHRDYPFLVSIQVLNKTWEHSCGGSIMTSDVVLTAGHCLISSKKPIKVDDPKNTRVVAGTTNLDETTEYRQARKAIKFVIHPDFGRPGTKEGEGDVGVVILDRPFSYNAEIQPLRVFSKELKTAVEEQQRLHQMGAHCFSPGWGLVSTNPEKETTSLKVAKEILLAGSVCREILCPWSQTYCSNFDDSEQLCAVAEDASVCAGDSGGPLVCHGFVFGVISRGPGCFRGVPQVYTNIQPILYFVDKYH